MGLGGEWGAQTPACPALGGTRCPGMGLLGQGVLRQNRAGRAQIWALGHARVHD